MIILFIFVDVGSTNVGWMLGEMWGTFNMFIWQYTKLANIWSDKCLVDVGWNARTFWHVHPIIDKSGHHLGWQMLDGCWVKCRDHLTCSSDNTKNWPTFGPTKLVGCWVKYRDFLTGALVISRPWVYVQHLLFRLTRWRFKKGKKFDFSKPNLKSSNKTNNRINWKYGKWNITQAFSAEILPSCVKALP